MVGTVYLLINILTIVFNNTYTLISLIQSYRYRNVFVYFNTLSELVPRRKYKKGTRPSRNHKESTEL